MNPFGQIVDLSTLGGIKPDSTPFGSTNIVDPNSLGIDFSAILGEKLSGELPFLFGEEANFVNSEPALSPEILSTKLAELKSSDLTGELTDAETEELLSQNNLIDPNKIGSEQFLKANHDETLGNNDKLSNDKTEISLELKIKSANPNSLNNGKIANSELKIDNFNLNNNNLISTQLDADNTDFEARPAVLAEIDKELTPKNNVDLKTAGLIDKVAGSLNIKNVKLDKNSENSLDAKEPVKLTLPTKSYIKVTPINEPVNDNKNLFAQSGQDLLPNSAELNPSESAIGDAEKIKSSNFKAIMRGELDQKPISLVDTSQTTNQIKLTSDFAPLGNNIEKVNITDTKIDVAPAKFVLPAEVNGNNIKNNHTVMIRMEPDHLGPVRMTVTTHNDNLSARLIVDSPLAKATVESNLNNLVNQLDRHGIKVDIFEVSVGGGEVGYEEKENRYSGSHQSTRQNLNRYGNLASINEVAAQRGKNRLYIAASGVNCFA